MVTEHALIHIVPGREAEFEAAFEGAKTHLLGAKGCGSVRLLRGVEEPSAYLLLVAWQTVEDHTEVFRGSEAFTAWRSEVGPYFDGLPDVSHFEG